MRNLISSYLAVETPNLDIIITFNLEGESSIDIITGIRELMNLGLKFKFLSYTMSSRRRNETQFYTYKHTQTHTHTK